jgi:hypothetical protein
MPVLIRVAKSLFSPPSPSPPVGGEGIGGKNFWQTLYLFWGNIYESQGKLDEAKAAYRKALPSQDLPKASRLSLEARLPRLSPVKAVK